MTCPPVVRPAQKSDAKRIADLSTQLGYPCTSAAINEKLEHILLSEDHFLLVAENTKEVVGYIHAMTREMQFYLPAIEVAALIVDVQYRGNGIGKLLLDAAEQFASERGFSQIVLYSNCIRTDAHRFYEKNGYFSTKSEKLYLKLL